MATRNQRKVTMPPKRVANQQDSYEKVKPKPTGPGVVSAKVPRIRDVDKPTPSDARRHADGKNHENGNMVKAPISTLKNEPDVGQKAVPSKVKFAPGVPNDKNIKRGYYPPGQRNIGKKRGSGAHYDANATYHLQVHTEY